MPHTFTVDMTLNTVVVVVSICITVCYIAYTSVQRAKHSNPGA